jgi:hypothetical protein
MSASAKTALANALAGLTGQGAGLVGGPGSTKLTNDTLSIVQNLAAPPLVSD